MSAAAVSPKLKAIVTGANKGIGFEIAKGLGGQGFHVIMACRDLALGETAAQELRSLHASTSFDVMELDVSKPDSIAKFIENVNANYSGSIDVLVNNAAIAFKNKDPMPFKDQAEPTFQPNFFGAVQLTMGLLPSIKNSSRKCIVNVASMAGHLKIFPAASPKRTKFESSASTLTVDELVGLAQQFVDDVKHERHAQEGWPNTNYGTSKCALIAFTKIIARTEPTVVINACCPGWVATDMSSHSGPKTPAQGAQTPVMLANFKEGSPSGRFFSDQVEIEW